MSDDLHKGLIRLGGSPFRRKVRKHKGEEWHPEKRVVNMEIGPWCPACRTNHPWRNKKTLAAKYYKNTAGLYIILWTCVKTGNVIKETPLLRSGRKES